MRPARIAFLRKILEDGPAEGLEPIDKWQDPYVAGKRGEYYLVYFGKESPKEWSFELPRAKWNGTLKLKVDVIDTWEMTVTPLDQVFHVKPQGDYRLTCEEHPRIPLAGSRDMALRLARESLRTSHIRMADLPAVDRRVAHASSSFQRPKNGPRVHAIERGVWRGATRKTRIGHDACCCTATRMPRCLSWMNSANLAPDASYSLTLAESRAYAPA